MKSPSELTLMPLLRVVDAKAKPVEGAINPFSDLLGAADHTLDVTDIEELPLNPPPLALEAAQAILIKPAVLSLDVAATEGGVKTNTDLLPSAAGNDRIEGQTGLGELIGDTKSDLLADITDFTNTKEDAGGNIDLAGFDLVEEQASSAPAKEILQALLPNRPIPIVPPIHFKPQGVPLELAPTPLPQTLIPQTPLAQDTALPAATTLPADPKSATKPAVSMTDMLAAAQQLAQPADTKTLSKAKAQILPQTVVATAVDAQVLAPVIEKSLKDAAKSKDEAKDKRTLDVLAPVLKDTAGGEDKRSVQGAVAMLTQIANEHRQQNGTAAQDEPVLATDMTKAPVSENVQAATTAPSSQANLAKGAEFAKTLQNTMGHAPVPEQVFVHLSSNAKNGEKHFTIQLDPLELGKVEVRLDIGADGKAVASISADNKDTLDLLQRDARTLERALEQAGLKTDSGSLSFNLRGGNQQNEYSNRHGGGYGGFFRDNAGEGDVGVVVQLDGTRTRAALSALDIQV